MELSRTVGMAIGDRPRPPWNHLSALARERWPFLAVLTAYVATWFVVPTWSPVPVSDDWVYARSVEILLNEHHLRILGLTVVTLVFQVFWGALFAAVFGMGYGALRLSTLVLVALAAWAFVGLLRELGVGRGGTTLGVAAFLFNPLLFSLGFSFMSDAPFVALLTIATCWYARGLRSGQASSHWILAGSAAAGIAFLVRQQGALIAPAVVAALLVGRRLRADRAGAALCLRIVGLPVVALGLYYTWIVLVNGVPSKQTEFVDNVRQAGLTGTRLLIGRLAFIEAMYVGFFALPIAAATLPALPRLVRTMTVRGWLLFAAPATGLAVGLAIFSADGRRMPYIPHFVSPSGLGPGDVYGGRPWVVGPGALDWATATCAVGAFVVCLALCRGVDVTLSPERASAGLVAAIALGQAVGAVPPSFTFRDWTFCGHNAPSLDRYVLPLLPLALALGLWALRGVRPVPVAGWLVVAAFAAFSVAGTRDSLG